MMCMSKLSVFLFTAAAVAASTLPRLRKGASSLSMSSSSSESGVQGQIMQGQYDEALLELRQPPKGSQYVPQLLLNDEILAQVVKDVRSILYVYVVSPPGSGHGQGNLSEYIASIYQRLWDEMIAFDKLGLQCVVMGDSQSQGFRSRSEMHAEPSLDAVLTFDDNVVGNINQSREALRLGQINHIRKTKAIDHLLPGSSGDGKDTGKGDIYFYENRDGDVSLPTFGNVALGGTFDRLHNGHRKLLTLAAGSCTRRLIIGITGDVMLSKKKGKDQIRSYQSRKEEVLSFLRSVKPGLDYEPVELADPFGPTITEASIEAIVVSSETVAGAHAINTKRKEAGLAPIATLVMRRSESATLSSTFIREREARGADTTAPATRGRGLMRVWAAVRALFTRESREQAL